MHLLFLCVDVCSLHHLPFEREHEIRFNSMLVMQRTDTCAPCPTTSHNRQSVVLIFAALLFLDWQQSINRNPSFEIFCNMSLINSPLIEKHTRATRFLRAFYWIFPQLFMNRKERAERSQRLGSWLHLSHKNKQHFHNARVTITSGKEESFRLRRRNTLSIQMGIANPVHDRIRTSI